MSQLIHMRQRLKAVQTIKKITSAMRLIARSLHTRMNHRKSSLYYYQKIITSNLIALCKKDPSWKSLLYTSTKKSQGFHPLYIIAGAQKGLCGSYNSELSYWLKKNKDSFLAQRAAALVVGKKTAELVQKSPITVLHITDELKINCIMQTTNTLLHSIKRYLPLYSDIIFVGNSSLSFFTHPLQETSLVPFSAETITPEEIQSSDNNDFLEDAEIFHELPLLLETLTEKYIHIKLYNLLFESLASEQASRFIAMDNATRNAEKFIDSLKLEYNKLRQAKITKELSELSALFQK